MTNAPNKPAGVYIHIPFCEVKCPYCNFYSLPSDEWLMDLYLQSILRSLRSAPDVGYVNTIYFGGGTPNLMGAKRLTKLIDAVSERFSILPGCEVTLEYNPCAHANNLLPTLVHSGFNRLSVGAQSADAGELAILGRRHNFSQTTLVAQLAAKAGFRHLSLDFMAGLPGQSPATLLHSLDAMLGLPIDHLSVYLLKREKGTPFYTNHPEPDSELVADLYLLTVDTLAGAGFEQYEISNFAKSSSQCLHNLKYWCLEPYIGLGPSAHSFIDGKRWFFPLNLSAFLAAENPFDLLQDDGSGGDGEEYVMLGLRLNKGISLSKAAAMGVDTAAIMLRAAPLAAAGYLTYTDENLSLTPNGFLISNSIISHLLTY